MRVEQLDGNADLFRSLVDQAGDALYIHRFSDRRILEVNRCACESLGYTRDELLNMTVEDIDPLVAEGVLDADFWKRVAASGSLTVESKHRRKNGSEFHVEVRASLAGTEEEPLVVALARDITERKRTERELAQAHEFTNTILDTTEALVVVLDTEGRIVRFNAACERLTGWRAEELIGREVFGILAPEEDRDGMENVFNRLCATGGPVAYQNGWVARDGVLHWIEWVNTVIRDNRGEVEYILATGIDMTRRKKAAEGLRESEERLRVALSAAEMGTWRWDPETDQDTRDASLNRLLGLEPVESTQAVSGFFECLHPDDRAAAGEAFERAIREHDTYAAEFRIVRPDGVVRWVRDQGRPFYDDDGRLLYVTGAIVDITERRQAEVDLARTEALLMAAVEKTPVGIVIADAPDGRIRMVNSAASRVRGVDPEELSNIPVESYSATWSLFKPDGTPFPPEELPLARAVVQGETARNVEVVIRTVKGEDRNVLVNATPVRDQDGNILAGVAVFSDFTELKRSEARLSSSEERYRLLFENMISACAAHEIVLDENGDPCDYIFLDVNRAFEEMTGLKAADIVGRRVTEALPGIEDDPADWIGTYGRVALTGESVRFENFSTDLQKWYTTLAYQPVKGQFVVMFFDITDRKTAELELQSHREHLEELVRDRTRDLQQKTDALGRAMVELESAQSQLVASEKMAVLGQLAAGIAHEVNNPLGAIASTSGSMRQAIERFLKDAELFATNFQGPTRDLLADAFAAGSTASDLQLSTRRRREIRMELEEKLARLDVDDARTAAELLIDLGLDQQVERYSSLLLQEHGARLLSRIRDLSRVFRGTRIIEIATNQAAKIVFALNSYARQSELHTRSACNLRQSIDDILTIYLNKMKDRVEVVVTSDDSIAVDGAADQLCQVWTNLIHNALQAMDFAGTLEISIRAEGDEAVVCVSDTGCGISEEHLDRVFDPFFTTKKAGEGCGLGLDICRGIIERHGGTIHAESTVGRGASFIVRLPRSQDSP